MSNLQLSSEQQMKVLALWADKNAKKLPPPSISELITEAWGRDFDPRSQEGIAVRDFLAERKMVLGNSKVESEINIKEVPVLSDTQKEIIKKNKDKGPVILARELFNNTKIHPFSLEAKLVKDYLRVITVQEIAGEEDGSQDELGRYRPPRGFNGIMKRIDKYVYGVIDRENMSATRREQIEKTGDFLNHFRFKATYNNYQEIEDKELLESSFISYVHDKPDLTAEEIDAYINLAMDVVGLAKLQRQIDYLNKLLDGCADDSDGKKIAMGLTEAISNANNELHQNKTRQDKLRESLAGKRKDRLNVELKQNASILALVRQWRDKTERDKIIKLAQRLEAKEKGEAERLSNVGELQAQIFGVSREDMTDFEE